MLKPLQKVAELQPSKAEDPAPAVPVSNAWRRLSYAHLLGMDGTGSAWRHMNSQTAKNSLGHDPWTNLLTSLMCAVRTGTVRPATSEKLEQQPVRCFPSQPAPA
jgi:hypothetical protein